MPIRIMGDRDSNVVDISTELMESLNVVVRLTGKGATVSIGHGCQVATGIHMTAGPECHVALGRHCSLGHLSLFAKAHTAIRVGDGVVFNGTVRLMSHETAPITVGSRCLFASGVDVMSSDMHSIIDVASGRRINPCEEIVVGEHVWIAKDVSVLKGARIGADTVIGAHSVVLGEIPANCVASGVPARVLRSGVTWSHERLPVDVISAGVS